jgi:hypothetical protein
MPSTLLDARPITRRYAARTVLDTADLHLDAAAGSVSRANGAGNPTRLRILADSQGYDHGLDTFSRSEKLVGGPIGHRTATPQPEPTLHCYERRP